MQRIVIDFETRSRVSLKLTNQAKYAAHPSTEVLCMSYARSSGGETYLWRPGDPFPFPAPWDDGCIIEAFNASFELAIWNGVCVSKYGWPELPADRIDCLQARASYAGLPRSLDGVCKALGMGKKGKDKEGNKVMNRLCRPQKKKGLGSAILNGCVFEGGGFDEAPEKHERNERYCLQDTVAERIVGRLAPPLPKAERRLWLAHMRINERGVPVDMSLCHNAQVMANRERERLHEKLFDVTGGQVEAPTQIARLKTWLESQGCNLPNLQEITINEALDGEFGELPGPVCQALQVRKLTRDAAVSKYTAISNHADNEGRCRGMHIYYKAGPGRWAGTGPQFQNMRRLNEDETDANVELADRISHASDIDSIYQELQARPAGVIPTLGGIVRMAACAGPGKKLVVCDYSAIEMRVLHWLAEDEQTLGQIADSDECEPLIDAWLDGRKRFNLDTIEKTQLQEYLTERGFPGAKGQEMYVLAAASIFGKSAWDVTKEERQRGKVLILGCGYMSGAEKFQAFCGQYGIEMPLDKAQELVQFYRRSYPLVRGFWYALGKAAVKAVKTGRRTECGPIDFYMTGHTLNARLPSGRELKYYDAGVFEGMYGEEIEALDQRSGYRRAVSLPVLVENCDQAVSRDLLADALVRCDKENLPVVLHVHDEIVVEVDSDDEETGRRLQEIMESPPSWSEGLPVAAKPGESRRYTK